MNFINIAISEAKKAYFKGEVPVGAVLVKNNQIIAKSHNIKEKKHNILGHAEVICIKKASKKLKTWKLDDLDLYVTLKPCSLCEVVIKHSRIKNVYYLLDKNESKKEYNQTNVCKIKDENIIEENYKNLLADFFKNKRKNK